MIHLGDETDVEAPIAFGAREAVVCEDTWPELQKREGRGRGWAKARESAGDRTRCVRCGEIW